MKNKKKVVIIVSLIVVVILVAIVYLYNTFASSSSISNSSSKVYDVTLSDSNSVTVPAYSSKTVYYKVYNSNEGTVSYGIGYTNYDGGVLIKELYDTIDYSSGTIDYRDNKYIKLKVINRSAKVQTTTLSTILGYENGGNLVVPNGYTLVKEKASMYATMKEETGTGAYGTSFIDSGTITRDNFASLTFVPDNEVPSGATSFDISSAGDKSVMLWYGSANSSGKYDVFIGYNADRLALTEGTKLFSGLRNISSLDVSCLYTGDITDMTNMFANTGYSSKEFTITGLESFDTKRVLDMTGVFNNVGYNSTSVSLDGIGGWNTSSVTSMSKAFSSVGRMATSFYIDKNISKWDTSSVTSMIGTFTNTGASASGWSLNLSKWDVKNVTKHTSFTNSSNITQPSWVS